jgi:hypothetical protein
MRNHRAAADVHPRLAAALKTQLERRRAALDQGARRVGWKIGGNIPEVDEVTGGRPAIGHLTSASLLDDGGTYRPSAAALHADVVIAAGAPGVGSPVSGYRRSR